MEKDLKDTIIGNLEYARCLCSEAEPGTWVNATLATMTVLESTMEMVRDNC